MLVIRFRQLVLLELVIGVNGMMGMFKGSGHWRVAGWQI